MPLTRPVRVLHVVRTPELSAGGFISYIDSLRAGLAGYPVSLALDSVFLRNQRARVLALKTPIRFFRRVQRTLAETDVLHVHGIFGWHVLLGVWAARRVGRPYVLTLHGHLHAEMMRERQLSKRVYLALIGNAILRDAAAILVTAPAEAAIVGQRVPSARVHQIVPGLTVANQPPPRPAPQAEAPLRLLFIGRLHPHKGLRELLQAMGNAIAQGARLHLQVAGHGHAHERRRVLRDIKRLGLDPHVELLGYIEPDERDRRLLTADVLPLPSRSENFGFVVAEALRVGVPVIVTDGVGLAPLVREHGCGTVMAVGDVDALTEALLDYHRDPGRLASQRAHAHAAARKCFSLEKMGAECAAVYTATVGQKPSPPGADGQNGGVKSHRVSA